MLIIAALSTLLLYKNNRLKKENNNLLIIKNKELKELQLQTELNFLKTQIQPHFFFNTLNNLYALIIEKSDKAKDVVLKLSELMEYSLYGVSNKNVPILNEINNIQNYLELEELRYSEKIYSTLNIEGELDNLKVPPLLYVTFIENCFKHGNVNGENFNLLISFKNNNDKDLIFTVKNTINEGMFIDLNKPKGIGIENVKRRLKILFKDDFTLKVTIENNMFCVYLRTPVEF